jgi:4'-phosphopantetheinyl transferase
LRATHLLARALVRTTLSRYASVPPESWRFEVGAHGKPEIVGAPGLRFNLSHTDGVVACAVAADVDVGVDVEDSQRRSSYLQVARRFFAAAEVDALERLPEVEQRQRFFEIWTLKEAYIKARGLGLPLPLRRFAFDRSDPASIAVAFDAELGESPEDWQLALARPTERHVLALALARGEAADRRVRSFRSVPLVEVDETELACAATSSARPAPG